MNTETQPKKIGVGQLGNGAETDVLAGGKPDVVTLVDDYVCKGQFMPAIAIDFEDVNGSLYSAALFSLC